MDDKGKYPTELSKQILQVSTIANLEGYYTYFNSLLGTSLFKLEYVNIKNKWIHQQYHHEIFGYQINASIHMLLLTPLV